MPLQRYSQILSDLVALFRSFVHEPRECFQIVRALPEMLGGSLQGRDWKSFPEERAPIPTLESAANPLTLYFKSHKEGKGIWKLEHYLDIYHRYFAKFVGKEVNVVEIGIFSGGSLEMWKTYFGPKSRIYGVDIREECQAYAGDRVDIFIGDQANRAFWKSFKEKVPKVDVLIDDGGHLSKQQITTLEEMLPHLRPGGVYLCEDIVSVPNHFPAYIYGLLRRLNAFEYHPSDLVVDTTPFQRSIHSVHLYPYVTVIEKSDVAAHHFRLPMQGTEWQPIADAGTREITLSGQS